MADNLQDFPYGPLDKYRQFASFDWKEMKVLITSRDVLKFQNRLHNEMKKYPLLYSGNLETPSTDEIQRTTAQKLIILEHVVKTLNKNQTFTPLELLSFVDTIYALDASLGIKYMSTFHMFPHAIREMGSERHNKFIEMSLNGDIYGSFCFTEIAHGSNPKGLRTTATYDLKRKQFILHTPDFQAAKCHVSFGKTANYSIVYAQLIMPCGDNKGLHAFVIKIHDSTLKPYPGVMVGDMGERIGVRGVDTAFVIFDNYPVPRESLLNRIGDVTEDGRYVTYCKGAEAYRVNFGIYADSRIRIVGIATSYLVKAITIAVRYAAVRKQFSPSEKEEEVSIIEYQSHQYRLLPYLSMAYALKMFSHHIYSIQFTTNKNSSPDAIVELHAFSCASKAIVSWLVRDAIQECREACGGHGYLKASGIGELRTNNDLNCSSEGDNYMLMQQTSDWLLKLWPSVLRGQPIITPFGSVDYLNNANEILKDKFKLATTNGILQPECILSAFKWLVCYMLKTTYEKYHLLLNNDSSKLAQFHAKNNSQIFYAKTLTTVYIQHFILYVTYKKIGETENLKLKNVLLMVFKLFGCWCLEKHISKMYSGGYAIGPNPVTLLQESILKLCKEVKLEAVALVDAIAHPDFILNSILGYSDGEVYKHLQAAIYQHPQAFARPTWWKEITERIGGAAKL